MYYQVGCGGRTTWSDLCAFRMILDAVIVGLVANFHPQLPSPVTALNTPPQAQTVKYNIPVAVWLPEQFPLAPPIVYVVPTPDMMIKPGHSVVDPSGSVASLYLENWLYPGSNLRILAEVGRQAGLADGVQQAGSRMPAWEWRAFR